jgi:ankyrin repeat protein
MQAARQGRKGVVKALLGRPGIDTNVADGEGGTALFYAKGEGHLDIEELLFAVGATQRS